MSDNLEKVFLRLAYALREYKECQNSTIILGAGCSLGATTRDISTMGIMRQCLVEHNKPEDEVYSYSWETLYKNFINIVWEGKAKKEKELLLKSKLSDIEPSSGHMYLRALVENGFINTVITTNFDMLLEKAFDGLSYYKRVGDNEYTTIGDSPTFTLMKVHGDLNGGEFRFAPSELSKLPENLQQDIFQKTAGLLLFIGYRGQDFGLMNSLNQLNDYAAYWIDINGSQMEDAFTSKHVYEFMFRRNSSSNFLGGREFGDFQQITEKLYHLLIESPQDSIIKCKQIVISSEWEGTTIIELLSIYRRLYELFLDILNVSHRISNSLRETNEIKIDFGDYGNALSAYLYFFKSQKLPSNLLNIPENEVDALVVGTSIEILVRTSINGLTPEFYINSLKREFEKGDYKSPILNDTFWDTVSDIVCTNSRYHRSIKLNMKKRLTLENYNVPSNNLNELLKVVQFLSLLSPNSLKINSVFNKNYQLHKLLVEKNEDIVFSDGKININIGQLSRNDLYNIFESYIKILPEIEFSNEEVSDNKHYMLFASKWVNLKIEIQNELPEHESISSIYNMCKEQSKQSRNQYMMLGSAFNTENEYVDLGLDVGLNEFLLSDYSAMFISGNSGSGKTSALYKLLNQKHDDEKFIPIIISPKFTEVSRAGISLFLGINIESQDEDALLRSINAAFELRNSIVVLIFDGINEISEGIKEQQLQYVALLTLAEKLYQKNLHNIKLIITCRKNSYFNYINATSLFLNPLYFYTNNKQQNGICEYEDASYQIEPLNKAEKEALIEQYIGKQVHTNIRDLLINNNVTPLFIAVAGETLKKFSDTSAINSINNIYSLFSQTMLKRIEPTEAFLTQKILYSYFEVILDNRGNNFEVRKFNLLEKIPMNYRDKFDSTIDKLIDVNIIIRDSYNTKKIKFCHDKIEEFFFKEYIEEYEYKGNLFFGDLFRICKKSELYREGFLQYSVELLEKGKTDLYINFFVETFEIYVDEIIPKMLVESLMLSSSLKYNLKHIFRICDINKKQKVVNLIIWGLNNSLEDYSTTSYGLLKIIKTLQEFVGKIYFPRDNIAALYYFESKIYYYDNNYVSAKSLADTALSKMNNSNYLLISTIKIHQAIIDMELGFSKRSIILFEEELENYQCKTNPQKFIEIGIELGRALNHSGQVTRALELYKSILKQPISSPYILSRIYEQKANVINRIMYEKLQYGFVNKEELSEEVLLHVEQLFYEAVDLYNKSIDIILKINALWSFSGVVPELINTYISYSYSIHEVGIEKCEDLMHNVENIFHDFTTPFKTDYYLSKAYYYEYLNMRDEAIKCINLAIDNAKELGIKAKEAKCYDFYSKFIYRYLLRHKNLHLPERKKWIANGIKYVGRAINYYYRYSLTEDNVVLNSCLMLKEKFRIIE